MKYSHHKDIDRSKWDLLVQESTNPQIYMLSWYLDITSPGWKAVIWPNYEAGFPLFVKKLFLFRYVPVALLSQQTGIIFNKGFNYQQALNQFFKSNFFKFFIRFTVNFHSGIVLSGLELQGSASFKLKKNYVLNLNSSEEELNRNFNENRKRNLKKAHKLGWSCMPSENITSAIEMYKSNQGAKQKDLKNVYQIIEKIFFECSNRNLAELYCCVNDKGDELAWGFFAKSEKKIYYLFGSMNEEGKKHSAISLIFEYVISKYSSQNLILDFEGGNIEGIGSYFESFGAKPETYYSLTRKLI
ncbi:MAG: hypothetical protein H7329_06560 [Opitutaceae bacterium]|nr:hypothetical protein [Cytophagales bacterium]